jgi:cardiolipin synthase
VTLTQSLKQTMETDGRRILKDNWKQQPASSRFMSWLSYGLVRLIMGLTGYARENSRARDERTPDPEE